MDGGELVHRVVVPGRVALVVEGALPGEDNKPGHVQPARLHLREGDLGLQIHRVVALGGEVGRVDVVVGVGRDDALVDRAGPGDHGFLGFVGGRLRAGVVAGIGACDGGEGEDEGERAGDGAAGRHGKNSLGSRRARPYHARSHMGSR